MPGKNVAEIVMRSLYAISGALWIAWKDENKKNSQTFLSESEEFCKHLWRSQISSQVEIAIFLLFMRL